MSEKYQLTEGDTMESGVRCPSCGSYTAFSDIIATGRCSRGGRRDGCEAALSIELVID